jgi:hypothetical protein
VINPTFVPDKSGAYGVSLLVSDGTRSSIANATLTAAAWFAANNASAPSTSALTVNRLRVDSTNSNVWAATNSGVWQSTNGGASWVQGPSGGPTTLTWNGATIAYRTTGAPLVYFSQGATCVAPFFERFDGTSWVATPGGACFPVAISADPTVTTGLTVVIGYKNGAATVGVTTDGFATVSTGFNNGLGTDNQISAVAVTANGSVLIGSDGTATNGGRIYRLPNVAAVQGAGPPTPTTTWTTVLNLNAGTGGTINALYADPTTGTVLAAVADGRVFQSTDHGATWTQRVAAGSAAAFDVYLDGTGNGFAAIGQGIFRSTNSGAAWSAASTGLPAANITAVALDPRTPGVGYAGAAGLGFFATFSGGQ